MRLLRVLCHDHDPRDADALRSAIGEFNRGLDIRLRFLSIGIEDREVEVDAGDEAAVAVERALEDRPADAVIVLGNGAEAVAATTFAVRCVPVVAHWDAGRREDAAADTRRAVDHLSTLLLVRGDEADAVLRAEGLADRIARVAAPDAPEFGRDVINALRAARARTSGDSTC